jgi:hypothetical protein
MFKFLPLIPILFLLTGCAGFDAGRVVTDTALAAGGAYLGDNLSDGDPLWSAAGAGGGVLLGETLHYSGERRRERSFTEGYHKGRSDAVKQQYWLMIDEHRAGPFSYEPAYSLFEIPVPEHVTGDGVIIQPHTRTIPIQEP